MKRSFTPWAFLPRGGPVYHGTSHEVAQDSSIEVKTKIRAHLVDAPPAVAAAGVLIELALVLKQPRLA